MKKCSRCKEVLPTSEFYKASSRSDGLACHCKLCCRELAIGRKHKDRTEYHLNRTRLFRANNPEKVLSHLIVQREIREGRMESVKNLLCDTCKKPAAEYHHADYSKPLEVIPLCKSCHRLVHNREKVNQP